MTIYVYHFSSHMQVTNSSYTALLKMWSFSNSFLGVLSIVTNEAF